MSEKDLSQPIEKKELTQKEKLQLLREPFPLNQVSKLPKESKAQKEERLKNRSVGISCQLCGGWHHKDVVHLDYVGHAALTHRLLEVDLNWDWEPMALSSEGLPLFDKTGGLWIKLYVAGMTRRGYGHAASSEYKDPGAREKEVIGDALRNAGMRFGMALDLWHKGDLHGPDDDQEPEKKLKADAPHAGQSAKPQGSSTTGRGNINQNTAPNASRSKPENKAPQQVPANFIFPKGFPIAEVVGKKISDFSSHKLGEIQVFCEVEAQNSAGNTTKRDSFLKIVNIIDLFIKTAVR